MSDYKSDSELMRLCAKAGGEPVKVSPELFTVLAKAQDVSAKSDGAFDVTVGPLVRLWRPRGELLGCRIPKNWPELRALVGYRNVRLDPSMKTVQLLKSGMQLDLGGIAKGYAADEALAVLKKCGINSALVAAGGDIAVSGPPPDKSGWDVAIVPLDVGDTSPHLLLHDAAVSTSGDAEQYVEINGVRYSHIVDPRTGLGLTGRSEVTVVARHGIDSDSLTKVAAVLGPEKGLPIIEAASAAARVVRLTDKSREIAVSKNFPQTTKRVYDNRLTPLIDPKPLLADHPDFIEPVREAARFEAQILVARTPMPTCRCGPGDSAITAGASSKCPTGSAPARRP